MGDALPTRATQAPTMGDASVPSQLHTTPAPTRPDKGMLQQSLSPTLFGEGMKRENEIVPESRNQQTTLKEDDLNACIQSIMCPVAPASQGVFWNVTWSSKQRIGPVCVASDQSRKYRLGTSGGGTVIGK